MLRRPGALLPGLTGWCWGPTCSRGGQGPRPQPLWPKVAPSAPPCGNRASSPASVAQGPSPRLSQMAAGSHYPLGGSNAPPPAQPGGHWCINPYQESPRSHPSSAQVPRRPPKTGEQEPAPWCGQAAPEARSRTRGPGWCHTRIARKPLGPRAPHYSTTWQ